MRFLRRAAALGLLVLAIPGIGARVARAGGVVQPMAATCPLEEKPPAEACRSWVCNSASGSWVAQNKANGTSCDDGNVCTTPDKCTNGVCGGTAASVATSCNDGNLCTSGDHCNGAKACVGGAATATDDGNPCTADACAPATGVTHTPVTGSCNDGNSCTTGDTCTAGVCAGQPSGAPCCDNGAPVSDGCCSNGAPMPSARTCTYACYDDLGRTTKRTVCAPGPTCAAACP